MLLQIYVRTCRFGNTFVPTAIRVFTDNVLPSEHRTDHIRNTQVVHDIHMYSTYIIRPVFTGYLCKNPLCAVFVMTSAVFVKYL